MEEQIQQKINELLDKAKKHKEIAEFHKDKIEEIRNKPLGQPQDDLETIGDVLDSIEHLTLAKHKIIDELLENQQLLEDYNIELEEERRRILNTKIYELPLTFDVIIKNLFTGKMSLKDLALYIKRIASKYNNQN